MVAQSPKLNIDDLLGTSLSRPANAIVRPVLIGVEPDLPPDPVFATTTMIATQCGPKPAGSLEPGDRILTRDNGYVEIAAIRMTSQPARQDRLLTSDRFQAAFGVREVLVGAQTGMAGARGVIISLVSPEIILADGLWTRASNESAALPRPVLSGREADLALRISGEIGSKHVSSAAR
jgi:Hint domain